MLTACASTVAMRLAFAEVTRDQDGDAHRELGHDEGDEVQ